MEVLEYLAFDGRYSVKSWESLLSKLDILIIMNQTPYNQLLFLLKRCLQSRWAIRLSDLFIWSSFTHLNKLFITLKMMSFSKRKLTSSCLSLNHKRRMWRDGQRRSGCAFFVVRSWIDKPQRMPSLTYSLTYYSFRFKNHNL